MLLFPRFMLLPPVVRIAGGIAIRQNFRGAAQLSAVAALRLPSTALPCFLAARMRDVIVVEIDGAAAHGLVVGGAVVALVDAAGRHEIGLFVAGDADLARGVGRGSI